MNRSEKYNLAGLAIIDAYDALKIETSPGDKEWVSLIMEAQEYIDDYVDGLPPEEYDTISDSIVTAVLNPKIESNLPQNVLVYCNQIHNRLVYLGGDRLHSFVRSVKLIFLSSRRAKKAKDAEEYFQYEIIEGRLSGLLVSLGIENEGGAKMMRQFGSLGILFDQLQDFQEDRDSGKHKLTASAFYVKGVSFFIKELLNKDKYLIAFLSDTKSKRLWKGGFKRLSNVIKKSPQ